MAKKKDDAVQQVREAIKDANSVADLPGVTQWIPTGSTVLDLAISNRYPGGIPVGRIYHIFGGTGTCKTVMAATTMGYAQRMGLETHYMDVEHMLAADFVKHACGLDLAKVDSIGYPETIEDLFDNWITGAMYPNGKPKKKTEWAKALNTKAKLIVVDSVSALPSVFEMEHKMDEQGYGAYRAKQLSLAYRKYIKELAESNTTVFLIDQARDNMGSAFGGETCSGGRSKDYYSSVAMHLKKFREVHNSNKIPIGVWTRFKNKKNNCGPPFREGMFRIMFDYGMDDICSNLVFLAHCQHGPEAASKVMTKIKFHGTERTRKSWVKHVEDENLEEELRQEVWKAWQELHKSEKRKERVW
jgi:recombination protein RecA